MNIHKMFLLLSAGLGFLVWMVFNPGIIDYDGMEYVYMAITGKFHDYRPMFPPLIMRMLFVVTYWIGVFTFIQSVAIFMLVFELLYSLIFKSHGNVRVSSISSFVILLLLMSATPLLYYAAYLENSSMLIILFLIASIVLVRSGSYLTWRQYIGLLFTLALMPLFRDSALICLLLFTPVLWFYSEKLAKNNSNLQHTLITLGPLILYVSLSIVMTSAIPHEKKHVSAEFMFLDIVGAIKLNPGVADTAPYVYSSFSPTWREGHRFGNMMRITTHVIKDYAPGDEMSQRILSEHELIRNEWLSVLIRHPVTLFRVKLITFAQFFNPKHEIGGWGWMRPLIAPWRVQILANPHFANIREILVTRGWDRKVTPSLWSHIQGGIIIWFPIGIFIAIQSIRRKNNYWRLMVLPIGYVLSYSIVTVNVWHKYMYPSTLLFQIVILSTLATMLCSSIMRSSLFMRDSRAKK